LEYELQLRAKLEAAEASANVLISNPELKATRRAVEKKITMWVSQISGTQEQVRTKAVQFIEVRGCFCDCLIGFERGAAAVGKGFSNIRL
jgi:hypothetical protein